jgi:uncharacterized membrane protein
MSRTRLEAFSDAVIAIVITIMVLELRAPHAAGWEALRALAPVFFSYVMSFVYLAIYWNNHHHMLHMAERIDGGILWANLHLLFWLSLIPFVTGWMGENQFAPLPTAVYGMVLLLAAIAYLVLQAALIARQGADSRLSRAIGRDVKGRASVGLYVLGIALAAASRWASIAIYALVAIIWIIPDRRIESQL